MNNHDLQRMLSWSRCTPRRWSRPASPVLSTALIRSPLRTPTEATGAPAPEPLWSSGCVQ